MKLLKFLGVFIILYFGFFFVSGMIRIIETLSFDIVYLEYTLIGLIVVLVIYYVVIPLISYMSIPSIHHLKAYLASDKYERKIIKYIEKKYQYSFQTKEGLIHFLEEKVDEFDDVIKKYAQQTTVTVMISPNSFIDGLSIIFANSKMIHQLTNIFGFRYSLRSLMQMYFSILTVASVTGLIEEFDETIEAIIEELAEEFSELIAEETGKSVSKGMPFMNIAINALSPIIQAAGNYAFVYYSGFQFKYELLNIIDQEGLSKKEIKKKARKKARQQRYDYIKDMSAKVLSGAGKRVMNLNPFKKKE